MKPRRAARRRNGAGSQPATGADVPGAVASKRFVTAVCLLLALATVAVYAQTFRYGYVYYDDDRYVYENPMILAGLSAKGIAWAFTTFYFANWHPLTWLSYLADYQFFGLNAGAEHAVNVAFHAAAAVLLFLALLRMTRRKWRCALVAAIFALHPLHVESVAWIAERKDVLSTFFQMLTLLLYARYVERPKPAGYAGVALAYALSLLAKPMAVTLPFVLLLLDLWPLGRIDLASVGRSLKRPIWEKMPLFAMSAAASVLTFLAQRSGGAMVSIAALPFTERLANAVVSYLRYAGKAFWPVNLAVLYPFQNPSPEAVAMAVVVLIAVTLWAAVEVRPRPYLLVGWLWYVGMLVPVVGLVQVGVQSMADRYTYVPLVGLSMAVVWALGDAVERRPYLRQAAAAVAVLAVAALAAVAYRQAGYWESSETLFRHTLAVTRRNTIMEGNLGLVLQHEGRRDEAAALFRQTLAYDPDNAGAQTNLGAILADEGKPAEAIALYRGALAADPTYVNAHINLAHELVRVGQFDSAYTEATEALRLKPDSAPAQEDIGVLLAARGKFEEARLHLEESVRLAPGNAEAQSDLCFVLWHVARLNEAAAACNAALRLKPDYLDAQFNLGNVLAAQGLTTAAAAEFSRVLAANPNHAAARAALDELQRRRH
ncbi:MAG: tetratricopeptide repeat protein [Bryobacteraceae bacterium]